MSSATTNRPATASRPRQFGDFNAPGRHNSDDRTAQTSSLGQTFGNGGTWQPSTSAIWSNTIGSGLGNVKRDVSRSRAVNEDYRDGPTGSGALATTSDPWNPRPNNDPWNPDTTSPIQTSHSGSTSPTHVRSSNATGPPSLSEIYPSQSGIRQQASYGRPQHKLDPSSGSFFIQKKFPYAEDKENMASGPDMDLGGRPFRRDQNLSHNSSYLGSGTPRDSSMPPSRGSDAGLSTNGLQFQSRNSFSSYGHTPNSSVHSQRPSYSGASANYYAQTNQSRYAEQSEMEMSEKFSAFNISELDASMHGQLGPSYSPSQMPYSQGYLVNGVLPEGSNFPKISNQYESFANQPFADQATYFVKPRYERSSVSPAGSDYRRGLNSPKFYSTGGTPPTEVFRPGSRGHRMAPQDTADPNRRLQTVHYAPQHAYYQQFQGQYPPPPYDYVPQQYRPQGAPVPYNFIPVPAFPTSQVIPTRPAKDQDVGVGVRSVLLEEFRSNAKSNKRYELKDLYHHVVEFSGDQHGSRFIQQKLETANSDEKEQLFREIQPNALQLMTDVFGNYVIQKLFEHGNQVQKRVLAEQMKNHVMELSMQMYGCRVVQKALEHVLADQQAELVAELQADVMKCIKDQNGNHVVQKAIERIPSEHIQFVIQAFRGQVNLLATHAYGCRVIQRILEYCKPHDQVAILEELHMCASMLVTDQYGNYVTQHIIQHGRPDDRTKIIRIVQPQILTLSKHKFASNVVEKCIQYGTEEQRKSIVSQLTTVQSDGISPLQLMMKDQYGNYVIQKLILQLQGEERDAFVENMKPQLISLKKYNFGKQIAAIEKLIYPEPPNGPSGQGQGHHMTPSSMIPPSLTQTMPMSIEIGSSAAPTPLLTNGQNSPQSSSLPSDIDVIDSAEKAVDEKVCPEVVINGV